MLARVRRSIDTHDEGFTLIELLVVIIIIGILAAIAIPVFLSQRKKGYQASMKSDLRTVADEMETNFTDTQTYVLANFSVGGSITGSGPVGSDSVSLSAGNTVTLVQAGKLGFCLQATSTKSSATVYSYNSLAGGLQPNGTVCPTSATLF